MPEIWILTDDRYGDPDAVGNKLEKYIREVFIDSQWNIKSFFGYDCSDAPKDSNGDYIFGCGDSSTYGLKDWWEDQQTFVEEADECALLAVPPHHYNGGGCGGGKTATAGVDAAVKEMADPDSGDLSLIGDSSNGDYCYNDPASTIAIALQEMAHSWGAAHADGMIWTNTDGKNVNHHTPMMLGDGQANNCGYDYDYNSSYDDRFVEGYTDCAADNIPYSVMSYSESEVKNL